MTRKESGSTTVLGCKYHGWSYNTAGELVKAPQFENVPGFDKAQNSLFGIHTQVSRSGFIFLNLDAGPTVSDAETPALDEFAERNGLGRVTWATGETLDGEFSWKFGCIIPPFHLPFVADLSSEIKAVHRYCRAGCTPLAIK